VCWHSVPWYGVSNEEMLCYSCRLVSGHGLAMVRLWGEAIEYVVVKTRLGLRFMLMVSMWMFSRPGRPHAWKGVGWVWARCELAPSSHCACVWVWGKWTAHTTITASVANTSPYNIDTAVWSGPFLRFVSDGSA